MGVGVLSGRPCVWPWSPYAKLAKRPCAEHGVYGRQRPSDRTPKTHALTYRVWIRSSCAAGLALKNLRLQQKCCRGLEKSAASTVPLQTMSFPHQLCGRQAVGVVCRSTYERTTLSCAKTAAQAEASDNFSCSHFSPDPFVICHVP